MSFESDACPNVQGHDFGCEVPADPALLAEGWVRRHLADPQRAAESIELYKSLGFEVMTQVVSPDAFAPACRECAFSACPAYVMIYTRPK